MADEFDIINRYFAGLPQSDLVKLGPGDDCAILSPTPGQDIVVSTDTLTTGVHFPHDARGAMVVQRAMGANLSDLAAMGAAPLAVLSALTLPHVDDQFLQDLSDAFRRECDAWQVPLVGGNLCRGELSLTLTVMGTVPEGSALRRDGAQAGDDLYVSGALGEAAGGLACLNANSENGETKVERPEDAQRRESIAQLIERYVHPTPRLMVGQRIRSIASAAIDISDGFTADLGHLCRASGVGAKVEVSDVPQSDALNQLFSDEADQMSLYGGDDYELCFTAGTEYRDEIEAISRDLQLALTRVGRMTEVEDGALVMLIQNGLEIDAAHAGYRHFSTDGPGGGE